MRYGARWDCPSLRRTVRRSRVAGLVRPLTCHIRPRVVYHPRPEIRNVQLLFSSKANKCFRNEWIKHWQIFNTEEDIL